MKKCGFMLIASMRKEKIVCALLGLICGATFSCHADLFFPAARVTSAGTDYFMETSTLPFGGGGEDAAFGLEIDLGNPASPVLRPTGWGSPGIGHVWYETTLDTVIDASFASSATPFYSIFDSANISEEIQMTINQPFMMAFRLGDEDISSTELYGWALLEYDGSDLQVLDSCAENDGIGIIAGQYQVPEPSSVVLFIIGTIGVWTLRKKR